MTNHLNEYIDYYQTLKEPGYAVLVSGDWGVGKTHQVRNCIQEQDCYYVSLFGLTNAREAHAAVYAAYAPTLTKLDNFVGGLGDAAKNAGGLMSLGGAATDWLNAAIRQKVKPDRTLIFDDLERCRMKLEEMFGLIATYVEHLGFRVVLIADEGRLKKKNHETYLEAKEKLIGHTIKAVPQVSEAYDFFVEKAVNGSSDFLKEHKSLILEVFAMSECKSLRVLRHVILDLARLQSCIEQRHFKRLGAMEKIVGLFVACSIEVRLGRLEVANLQKRAGTRMGYEIRRRSSKSNEVEIPKLVEADERYIAVDLEEQILEDDVLVQILGHGVFDKIKITESIDQSSYFQERSDLPAWRLLASFDELDDDEVEKAHSLVMTQFYKREVTESGEMLHIFALLMLMAEEGIVEQTLESVREDCMRYIQDLFNQGRLPPRGLDWRWWDSFDQSYGGYSYWLRPSYADHFKLIWDFLIKRREDVLELEFPKICTELLDTLQRDGIEFYRQVCHTNGHDSPYALIPVFKALDPIEFVDAWLAAPRPAWRWVCRALEDRLEPHRVERELASEFNWAVQVLDEVEKRRDALDGFRRLRMDRIIPKKLKYLRQDDSKPEDGGDVLN